MPTRTVELLTENLHILGQTTADFLRLTDYLNNLDQHYAELTKARITDFGKSAVPEARNWACIPKLNVRIGIPHDQAVLKPNDEDRLFSSDQQKMPVAVELYVPPFTCRGEIHLPSYLPVTSSLKGWGTAFIPITQATISVIGNSRHTWKCAVAIVNKARIEAIYPQTEG